MKISALFTSAGRRVELIQCFRSDAIDLGIQFKAVACDLCPELSAACRLADASHTVPRCTAHDYITALLEICQRHKTNLLIPTIDTELAILSANAENFLSHGIRVLVSSPDVIRITRNKLLTAEILSKAGVVTPKTSSIQNLLENPEAWQYPIIIKPIDGSSSVGLSFCNEPSDTKKLSPSDRRNLAQEFIRGREFTVNMFFDQSGKLRCAVPHWRREIRAGEVSKGTTIRHPELINCAAKIASALIGARGAICFQAVVGEDNSSAVFEINARFGGGFPLAHRAGARFSKWILEETMGIESTASDHWIDNLSMVRYDSALYFGGQNG